MEPEKVIFLDVDGVAITGRSHLAFGKIGGLMTKPDPVTLAFLRRMTNNREVQLVVSSTWRLGGKEAARVALRGLMDRTHEDWRTPDFQEVMGRGKEIADWLQRHPGVKDYLILDDDRDMLPEQMPHLVQTTMKDGLSFDQMVRIRDWAGKMKRPGRAKPRPAGPDLGKTR